jgi:hypothetical protein
MPHLYDHTQAVILNYNARMTLHLITIGTKGNLTMRKHNCMNKDGCLCPPQKWKRDYMHTRQYKQLAHAPTQLRRAPERLYVRLSRDNIDTKNL